MPRLERLVAREHVITGHPPSAVTGRGTGIDRAARQRKVAVIEQALAPTDASTPTGSVTWRACRGFEIGGLAGLCLGAAHHRHPCPARRSDLDRGSARRRCARPAHRQLRSERPPHRSPCPNQYCSRVCLEDTLGSYDLVKEDLAQNGLAPARIGWICFGLRHGPHDGLRSRHFAEYRAEHWPRSLHAGRGKGHDGGIGCCRRAVGVAGIRPVFVGGRRSNLAPVGRSYYEHRPDGWTERVCMG